MGDFQDPRPAVPGRGVTAKGNDWRQEVSQKLKELDGRELRWTLVQVALDKLHHSDTFTYAMERSKVAKAIETILGDGEKVGNAQVC